MNSKKKKIILFIAIIIPLLGLTMYSGIKMNHYTLKRAEIRKKLSEVNDAYYGVLSVNAWEKKIRKVVSSQIMNFSLTAKQDSLFRIQINQILHVLINESNKYIQENDETIKNKIRKTAVDMFVNVDKVKGNVPNYTDALIDKLTEPETLERIKKLALLKIDQLAAQTRDSLSQPDYNDYFKNYNVQNKKTLNRKLDDKVKEYRKRAYFYMRIILSVSMIFLLIWFFVPNQVYLKKIFFISSVIFALLILITGVLSPMIEIDARINEMHLILLGEKLSFEDQTIFYRSKSIFEVVHVLFQTGQFQSIIVGVLILSFSILLPMSKILFMGVIILSKKVRQSTLISWIVYKSGKWSMADVIVVAIFMSYIAFDSILKNQLSTIETNTETMKAITTNQTSLQAGFYIFLCYVIFSLILSSILSSLVKNIEQ